MKIVLAYSGGLDTSVLLSWIREKYSAEVIAFCADIGQEEETKGLRPKARKTGAADVYIDDLREEFATDFIFPMMQAGAIYEGQYFLGTSIARPLIAKRMVQIARKHKAQAIAHGATGKGNKTRIVPVGGRARAALESYLSNERPGLVKRHTSSEIFLSVRGGPLGPDRVRKIVKERARQAGFEQNIYPHLLRHSFATHLLRDRAGDCLPVSTAGGASPTGRRVRVASSKPSRSSIYRHGSAGSCRCWRFPVRVPRGGGVGINGGEFSGSAQVIKEIAVLE